MAWSYQKERKEGAKKSEERREEGGKEGRQEGREEGRKETAWDAGMTTVFFPSVYRTSSSLTTDSNVPESPKDLMAHCNIATLLAHFLSVGSKCFLEKTGVGALYGTAAETPSTWKHTLETC